VKAVPPPAAPTTPQAPVDPLPSGDVSPDQAPPIADGPAAKVVRWPEWFTALDIVLGITAVIFAFLMASFTAKNSDVWLHLAGGRLIANGELNLGSDPFGVSAPERPWIHTTWLYDITAYGLYQLDASGVVLVAVKATVFAAAFLVLAFLRRPGCSVLPWAVAGLLGILAAAPYAHLRPPVVSFFFFSLTLVLLHRLDWKTGTWASPLKLAGLFTVWANVDAWFFLGPLLVATLWLGELLHGLLLAKDDEEAGGVFGEAVPRAALLRTLLAGSAACLLNPFLIAAIATDPSEAFAQLLPVELGFSLPPGASEDINLSALTLTPLSADYLNKPYLGNGINGSAFAVLLLLGIIGLTAGFARLRGTHLTLWFVFGALAFTQIRLIPFFALASIPLIAGHWNGLAERIRLGSANANNDRLILTFAGFGRVLLVVLGFAMLILTYPGWLQPQMPRNNFQSRLDWGLGTDAGLERSAKKLAELRDGIDLPPEITGLNVSLEFGNYCAWFAPGERTFVNSRYAFHRNELPDLLTLGQIVPARATEGDSREAIREIGRVMEERKASYLSVASPRSPDLQVVFSLWANEQQYVLWHLDGRFVVLGRLGEDAARNDIIRKLKYDPVRVAFDPKQEPMPEGKSLPPLLPNDDTLVQFLDRPLPIPAESDDAQVYARFEDILGRRNQYLAQQQSERSRFARGVFGGIAQNLQLPPVQTFDDDLLALPILQLRAARRALASNPDLLDGWSALVQAYTSPYAPSAIPADVELQLLTARVQLLDRLPTPSQANPFQAQFAFTIAEKLFESFVQAQQFDTAKKYFGLYEDYFSKLPKELQKQIALQRIPAQRGVANPDTALKTFLEAVEQQADTLRRETQKKNDFIDRQPTNQAKFEQATQLGMPLRALKVFNDVSETELARWPRPLQIRRIEIEVQTGHIEQMSATLEANKDDLDKLFSQQSDDPNINALRQLQGMRYRLEGNYAAAAKVLVRPAYPNVTYDPTLAKLPEIFSGLMILGGGTAAPWVTGDQDVLQALAGLPLNQHLNKMALARNILIADSLYSYDRGLIALIDGRIEEAKVWLTNAANPQGVPLGNLGVPDRLFRITRYLAMIEKASVSSK